MTAGQAENGASADIHAMMDRLRADRPELLVLVGQWREQARLNSEALEVTRTDLERVTAERDAMREVCDLARKEAQRHTKGSVAVTAVTKRHYCKGCSSNSQPWPCEAKPMIDALARFDATRKATADAETTRPV
jgi:hypothetical protein